MHLRKLLLPLLAVSAAGLAQADEFHAKSSVSAVTLYVDAARITRQAQFDLPEGRHRLVLTDIPRTADLSTLQINLTGAQQTALLFREDGVPPRDATDPAVQAAEEVLRAAQAEMQLVHDEAAEARSEAEAARAALGFLAQLGSNEGLAESGADALRDISRMIAQEAGSAGQQALAAEVRARKIEEGLETLRKQVKAAKQALEAIQREDEDRLYLAVEVDVPEAGSAGIELSYFSQGVSDVMPTSEWHLSTGEKAEVLLKRGFGLQQQTGENWQDIDLTISTQQPLDQGEPSLLFAERRQIQDPLPAAPKQRVLALADSAGALAEPIVQPVVIEEVQSAWSIDTQGPGAVYHFDYPVSIASGADVLKLEMDQLTTEAEVVAVAVPRRDQTAYRVAHISNSFGEFLLPSYPVPMFVDGKLVTLGNFNGLVAGQEAELGFGSIPGLRLSRNVLSKSEGGRGVISRSNQQNEAVEISVENLTEQSWNIRLLDRVPYTQQEDLEITWQAQPHPVEENVKKQRGILAWEFDLAPGGEKLIQLETTLSWPEGKVLR
ncbi:hypothetical protein RSK20926_06262 [Roseobacter sp. SK209-2-6]|uniref:DUF4139 domain-containing protein n=1 Tax=Roseobacter sp. SK209-2-6 TaxID=388739 RepID=UPI0000F3D87A|nr:mucoidy inhibitor MuiA family protein [Roseobacter sp. SK209-2-6]EBA17317.1 hypothetical protein RSK20926_06262 [Roseobacter sp. SK209-2-6]